MTRRGFTLVEVIITVVIFGILVNLAIPAVQSARKKAEAASAIGHFNAIRVAAYEFFADNGSYPKSGKWGEVPRELAQSLPANFSFDKDGVRYRWRRWSLPNGLPRKRNQSVLLGVEVRPDDPEVLQAIKNLYRGQQHRGNRTRVTLVIE